MSRQADGATSSWRWLTSPWTWLVFAMLACALPLLGALDLYGRGDWDQFTFRYATPRLALLRDHQLPFWNPYVNGGTVLLAHPHSPVLSPWYAIVLLLGASLGLRVQVAVFMVLGAVGMAKLVRRLGATPAGSFVGGVVFMMNAHFLLQIAEGHLEWTVMGLMPWVAICLLDLPARPRYVIGGALILASALLLGSVYIMAIYVPFLTLWAALEAMRTRSGRLPALWVGTLALAALLSAAKLLPQLEFVGDSPREVSSVGLSAKGLVPMFLDPRQAFLYEATSEGEFVGRMEGRGVSNEVARTLPEDVSASVVAWLGPLGVDHQWHEYGAYITYSGLALAALGVVVSWASMWPLYLATTGALIIVLGDRAVVDLFGVLQRLPLYGSLQTPSRFLAAVVFGLAVAAALGTSWLDRRAVGWRSLMVRRLVPAAICAELMVLGWSLFGDVFVLEPRPVATYADFATRQADVTTYFPMMNSYLMPLLRSNSGVLSGYENLQVGRGQVQIAGSDGYRGEAYLGSGGPVRIESWTMSRVTVAVPLAATDTLTLNQNYYGGWRARIRSAEGLRRASAFAGPGGLVSIDVRPGDTEVDLYYRPRSAVLGGGISLMALLLCAGLAVRSRRPEGSPPMCQ